MRTRFIAIMILMMTFIFNIATVALAVGITIDRENEEYKQLYKNYVLHSKAKMPEIELNQDETVTTVTIDDKFEIEEFDVPVTSYQVTSGDTLWMIAQKVYNNGCLYPWIMKSNNMTSETIKEGQTLKIDYVDNYDEVLAYCYDFMEENLKTTNVKNSKAPSKEGMTYIGNYKITGYDPWCAHCCGKSDGITASGREAVVGRTIAAKGFKFGTKLYIEGYGTYTVEDTGAFKPSTIDIAANSHDECYDLTKWNVPVYKVN